MKKLFATLTTHANWVLFILAVLAIAVPISCMYVPIQGSLSLLLSFGNAIIVVMFFVLLPPRFRWIVLIPIWLIAIFLESNMLYMRCLADFIPIRDYFLFQNYSGITFNAGLSMVHIADLALILPAVTTTLIYLIWLRKPVATTSSCFSTKSKIIILTASTFYFATVELGHTCYRHHNETKPYLKVIQQKYSILNTKWNTVTDYIMSGGPVIYIIKGCIRELYFSLLSHELNDKEHELLDEFWNYHHSIQFRLPNNIASIFNKNKDKNLIFIVVESLNANAVNYKYGENKLMPVLSGLIDANGSVSTLEMIPQVRSGVSSDGQLILNTGLYPASDCTTVGMYGDNNFPSLAKILKQRYSFEIICEKESLWNHRITNKSFGYNTLVSNLNELALEQGTGCDETLFDTSLTIIDTLPNTFFAFLTTMSMHSPYKDKNVKRPNWISDIPDISEKMRDYLTMSNYFDTALGKFINELKQCGMYDNSIIVIASDHDAPIDGMTGPVGSNRIVFVALNTGITLKIEHPVGQVDAFPTILHIMGQENEYTGMGISMFNPTNTGAIDKFGQIIGENISPQLDSLLRLSSDVANIMHRTNTYE